MACEFLWDARTVLYPDCDSDYTHLGSDINFIELDFKKKMRAYISTGKIQMCSLLTLYQWDFHGFDPWAILFM